MNTNLTNFDRLFNQLSKFGVGFEPLLSRLNEVHFVEGGFPPYDIIETDPNHYEIQLAVAGYDPADIEIDLHNGKLSVTGNVVNKSQDDLRYVHKGIAKRSFVREFTLGEYVEVKNADLKNGMLTISLVRELPESAKPKKIAING